MGWILLIAFIWIVGLISENKSRSKRKNISNKKKSEYATNGKTAHEETLQSLEVETIQAKNALEKQDDDIYPETISSESETLVREDEESKEEPFYHGTGHVTFISARARERGIEKVLHFTRVENLRSIFAHGLRGVNYLRAQNLLYAYNDEHRFDQRLDGVSLSITHPNSLMLYKYRKYGRAGAWAILLLEPTVLDQDCLFFRSNAASNAERFKSANALRGVDSFEQMFEGSSYSHVPTDVQAEVICMEPISSNLIKAIAFQNSYEERSAKTFQLPVPTFVDRNLFERSPFHGVN